MIKSIVVVGGGTAGWITAGLIAEKHVNQGSPFSVTLIESPDIGTIGVGEGTWPTMVHTLKQLGISETEFLKRCDASFKQASKFCKWVDGSDGDQYYHPFSPPQGFDSVNLVPTWQNQSTTESFAEAVSLQAHLCEKKLGPKQANHNEYSSVENHGYHLDAGKFTQLLTEHCTSQLGVKHIQDNVISVNGAPGEDIKNVSTEKHGEIDGDLFIDCSGSAGLLIDKHYQVPFICKKDVLFIDRALAVQVPYQSPNDDIESATLSTAQTAGWIWDIGLPTRRGVGYVYSSKYINRELAEAELKQYLATSVDDVDALSFREIRIKPGYRSQLWVNNCVAVGMASGFLEPLEASALVMIETAAKTIALHMPASRNGMDVVAKRYNDNMLFRWERIIDFLKLHYVLSKREDTPFWLDNKKTESIPESLQDLLTLWKYQGPTNNGFLSPYDLFPAASYQYILYGMGFETQANYLGSQDSDMTNATEQLLKVKERINKVLPLLPSNRSLLNELTGKHQSRNFDFSSNDCTNWRYIKSEEIHLVAQKLPIFFRQQENKEWSLIALVGLDKTEDLFIEEQSTQLFYQTSPCKHSSIARLNQFMQKQPLLEPVDLDITFNDQSSLRMKGLHVLSKRKLENLTQQEKQLIETEEWAKYIGPLMFSLQHVPKLISLKNQKL
jgi:flavin-dependent dehydrogenase